MHKTNYLKIIRVIAFTIFTFYYGLATPYLTIAGAKQLTIIGTGDLHGQLETNAKTITLAETTSKIKVVGGISRLASLIQQIKQETPTPVIVLSSGDDLMGKYFQQFNGEATYSLMNKAGYEILALGNHDFDRGVDVLAKALSRVNITPLCSDLRWSSGRFFFINDREFPCCHNRNRYQYETRP